MGIAGKVVQHTINTLNIGSYIEFISRCYNGQTPCEIHHLINNLNLENKITELQRIKDRQYSNDNILKWNSIWVSQQDKIFPSKNQKNAWQNCPLNLIRDAHAPFQRWANWQDIISN